MKTKLLAAGTGVFLLVMFTLSLNNQALGTEGSDSGSSDTDDPIGTCVVTKLPPLQTPPVTFSALEGFLGFLDGAEQGSNNDPLNINMNLSVPNPMNPLWVQIAADIEKPSVPLRTRIVRADINAIGDQLKNLSHDNTVLLNLFPDVLLNAASHHYRLGEFASGSVFMWSGHTSSGPHSIIHAVFSGDTFNIRLKLGNKLYKVASLPEADDVFLFLEFDNPYEHQGTCSTSDDE